MIFCYDLLAPVKRQGNQRGYKHACGTDTDGMTSAQAVSQTCKLCDERGVIGRSSNAFELRREMLVPFPCGAGRNRCSGASNHNIEMNNL